MPIGIITESNVGALFIVGIIPGIIGVLGYTTTVQIVTHFKPHLGPPAERTPWSQRMRALRQVWGVLALFIIVMGGIYGGVFTPEEAAGVGASGALLFALLRRKISWQTLSQVLMESADTTARIFIVLIGALIFANFVNLTGLPRDLAEWTVSINTAPIVVVLVIMVIYIFLGCVLDSLSMILLTVPIFFPLMMELGYSPIWFGIVVVVVTEISLITPPIGLNVFVLRAMVPDIKTTTIFRGVTPFWCADIVRLAILVGFPGISLILPSMILR